MSTVGGSVALIWSVYTSYYGKDVAVLQSQRRKGVHDQIQPQQLHCPEDTLVPAVVDGRDHGQQNGGDVDGDLELSSQSRILYIE